MDDSDDVECVKSGALLVSGVHTNSTITAGRAGTPFLSVQLCQNSTVKCVSIEEPESSLEGPPPRREVSWV